MLNTEYIEIASTNKNNYERFLKFFFKISNNLIFTYGILSMKLRIKKGPFKMIALL